MSSFAERLGLQRPIVQAGMGGGLSGARLAAAVSNAGGLGTVGILPDARSFEAELRRARELAPGRPLAANLLLPFARRAHAEACIAAGIDVVVLFCGSSPELVAQLRGAGIVVQQQVGTVDQARQALRDGVDGLIAQGIEAGGHLLGEQPTLTALGRMLDLAGERPVLAAGGIHSAAGAAAALAAGAAAVVAGTRFLLTDESGAHPPTRRASSAPGARWTRCSSPWAGATATASPPTPRPTAGARAPSAAPPASWRSTAVGARVAAPTAPDGDGDHFEAAPRHPALRSRRRSRGHGRAPARRHPAVRRPLRR